MLMHNRISLYIPESKQFRTFPLNSYCKVQKLSSCVNTTEYITFIPVYIIYTCLRKYQLGECDAILV